MLTTHYYFYLSVCGTRTYGTLHQFFICESTNQIAAVMDTVRGNF